MIRRALTIATTAAVAAAAATPAKADIVSASDSHYVLRHEGTTALSPEATWQRLVAPRSWWHPDHTYSGDAENLEFDARAGGLWREEWPGGSVAHGQVLSVIPGKTLRLEAPFGPLQGVGAYTIWTITLEAIDGGTLVVFDESSIGPPSADMAELAKAVDYVKAEAMRRLTGEDGD
jgi:uncharacterized protein YndB with AHSA1/START domain